MRSRRAARPWAVLVGAALGLVAVLLAAPVTMFPGGATPADCASADTGVTVGLVVDFGVLVAEQGAPASVTRQCVPVATGGNGFSVLSAADHHFTVNSSGLLCSIDGYPSGSECGTRTTDGYRYWAYFTGGSSWTYSGVGPGSRRVSEGAVDGWHFVVGAGRPTDPPPNGSPQSCPPPAPPSTAPAPTSPPGPSATVTQTAPGAGPMSTVPGALPGGRTNPPPVAGASSTTPANPAAGATTVPPVAGAAGAATPSDQGAVPPGTDGTPPGDGAAATVPGTDPAPHASDDAPTAAGASSETRPGEVEVAATPTAASSTGAPAAPVLVVLVVIALGGFAAVRLRGRREDP